MKGKVFLLQKGQEGKQLIPMEETEYEQEAVLQDWLSNYPELLPGDQINPDDPRRWLLVKAEMGVPDKQGGSARWSLDHLFLDQDGIPTFVECKRSTDTRARREVVAQMLDYAANGLQYWTMDRIRRTASETSRQELDERVLELLNTENRDAVEEFWAKVEHNLQEGQVRLLFVADQTTKELRRLVEFLNEKLMDIEVLIIEVKQFSSVSQTAVVPRVIGATEAARGKKPVGSTPRRSTAWTEEEFLERLTSSERSENLEIVKMILKWAKATGLKTEGGRGRKSASLNLLKELHGGIRRPFQLYDSAYATRFYINLSELGFDIDDTEQGRELLARLSEIGFSASEGVQYPSIRCEELVEPRVWDKLIRTLEWILS